MHQQREVAVAHERHGEALRAVVADRLAAVRAHLRGVDVRQIVRLFVVAVGQEGPRLVGAEFAEAASIAASATAIPPNSHGRGAAMAAATIASASSAPRSCRQARRGVVAVGQIGEKPRRVGMAAHDDAVGQGRSVAEDEHAAPAVRLLGGQQQIAEPFAGVVAVVAHHRRAVGLVARVVPTVAADKHGPGGAADAQGRAGHVAEFVLLVADALAGRVREGLVRVQPAADGEHRGIEIHADRARISLMRLS